MSLAKVLLKMRNSTPPKLNLRLNDIIRAGLGIISVDGGFIIAIQVISFLLTYFAATRHVNINDIQSFAHISKTSILLYLINILNLAVIIVRICGLANGIQYKPVLCYQLALRRWPNLIFLYLLGTMLLANITKTTPIYQNPLLMLSIISLLPCCVLACIFVVENAKSPLQAILSTFNIIRTISVRLLLSTSLLYTLPFLLTTILGNQRTYQYLALFNSIWFLFCHVCMVVIYTSVKLVNTQKPTQTKVIVI